MQLYAFDIMALDGDETCGLPLSMRRAYPPRGRAEYVRCALRTGEIGPDLFRATLRHRITGASVNAAGPTVSGAPIEALGEGEGPEASGDGASDI